jgi:hypothetical protein
LLVILKQQLDFKIWMECDTQSVSKTMKFTTSVIKPETKAEIETFSMLFDTTWCQLKKIRTVASTHNLGLLYKISELPKKKVGCELRFRSSVGFYRWFQCRCRRSCSLVMNSLAFRILWRSLNMLCH